MNVRSRNCPRPWSGPFHLRAPIVAIALLLAPPAIMAAGDSVEKFSSDTVRLHRIDSHITPRDTGASGKKTECTFDPVFMSHHTHNDLNKISCITCHHRKNNDERIKECAQCHKGVDGLDKMHKRCGSCHQKRNMNMRCSSCHRDLTPSAFIKGMIVGDIKLARVRFSHSNHLLRKPDCAACHKGKEKNFWQQSENFPKMDECMKCHNGAKAPKNCTQCHQDVKQIKPESHQRQWLARGGHGEQSLFDGKSCNQCHEKKDCNRCHRGQTACKIHPAGYKFMHGIDARSGAMNCSMCHQTKLYCGKCHERRL